MNSTFAVPYQISLQIPAQRSLFVFNNKADNLSWPSLYDPLIDLAAPPGSGPVQPGGRYLTNVYDIFRFTLYWTLIFHIPPYILVGIYAFLNVLFPPTRRQVADWAEKGNDADDAGRGGEHIPLESLHPHDAAHDMPAFQRSSMPSLHHGDGPRESRPRLNVRRTRLTFALVIFFSFVLLSIFSAVAGAAIMGFVIAGVYKAGGFWVSTWVPFIWAVIHALVGLLGMWPSVIDII